MQMLRYSSDKQLTIEGFKTPFDVHLNPENKWVRLANAIPWDEFVEIYTRSMSKTHGRPSISPRIAVSALIIKHMERLDDRGVVAALEENIYLQYFAGYPSFTIKPPFDPSLLVEMRARMGAKAFDEMSVVIIRKAKSLIEEITAKKASKANKGKGNKSKTKKNDFEISDRDRAALNATPAESQTAKTENPNNLRTTEEKQEVKIDTPSNPYDENTIQISQPVVNVDSAISSLEITEDAAIVPPPNQGKLKIDATVADQMIKFPTDIGLLNRSREESERLIDIIYPQTPLTLKPRTYRKKARKEYLAVAMKKKKTKRQIRLMISKQLRYLKRNITTIMSLLDHFEVIPLHHRDLRILWVIQQIYDQQKTMYDSRANSHPHRIVSIYQPHVRPIPRGKDKYSIEFGAKLGVSEVCGFSRIDHISWDAYSESKDLTLQVENYKQLFGYYPEVVLADGAYMGRENRAYLHQRNIRHIGKTLGRPRQLSTAQKRSMRLERGERNHIEGKFGQAKNGYGLTNIRARRKDTSEAWIGGIWLAMNLKRYMSLQPVVALLAIIQLVIAFLYPFLDKITAWGEATTACWGELKRSFDSGEPCQPVLGSTPSWVGAH